SKSRIKVIYNDSGDAFYGNDVAKEFVSHFSNFLGTCDNVFDIEDPRSLFTKKLEVDKAIEMIKPVSYEKINRALFSIGDNKSSGPDGYTSRILGELNSTLISLVPKVSSPAKITDYRPISCCNVVNKTISKVITNRIKLVLGDLVDLNQSVFILERLISDNILLAQEFMKGYNWDIGVRNCAFKIDTQKAYDTVSWEFLASILRMFRAKRGLRQGDPVSPYLFTLVMEVLNLMVKRQTRRDKRFRRGLDEFSMSFGLYPSMNKSNVFFCNIPTDVKEEIKLVMPFREGVLPIRYLRVPLVSKRVTKNDCRVLMEVYWCSLFILPIIVSDDIVSLLCNFLWSNKGSSGSMVSIKWVDVCRPKSQGGLGLKSMHEWNTALMAKHLWNIIISKDSIWVKWVKIHKLKGKNLWEIELNRGMSWCWKHLLNLRDKIKEFVYVKLGNRKSCSLWFDKWYPRGPLSKLIDVRMIGLTGLSTNAKRLWERLKPMALLEDLGNEWAMVISGVTNKPAKNIIWSVIQRLTFGAAIYFLWQERNNRRVELRERSIDILFNVIVDSVRLKLMGLTLEGTPNVIKASKVGSLPVKIDKNVFSKLSDLATSTLYSSGWVSSSSRVIMVDDIFFSLFAFYCLLSFGIWDSDLPQFFLMIQSLDHWYRIFNKKTKIKAKRTKPGTGMKTARKTETEGGGGPSHRLYLCWIILLYRYAKTELITSNLVCPSTYQLLRSSSGNFGPDMSFDKSASLECLLSLAHHWKSGFFLIDRRAIPDSMVWRHPSAAIDDPRPAAVSFSMADKSRVCDPVLRGADGNVMGIHDFLCLPEWTGTEVQEEPHHDIKLTLQSLPFYCTLPAAADAVISDPTPKDLAVGTPSAKILTKDEVSHKRKASTSGATSSQVARRTRSALAQPSSSTTNPGPFMNDSDNESDDDDAWNQGGSFAAPAAEVTSTRDSWGKGNMVDDDAAPSVGASRSRPSFEPTPSFQDVSGDAIHMDFFSFFAGPYYAVYPEGGVARNCEFTREEWDAPYRPTFRVLTKEVFKDLIICKMVLDQFPTPREMVWVKTLSDDQLTTKMSVLHCMMMSHGADSRLKGYEERVAGLTELELQVSTLKRQVFELNDKLSSTDASLTKSKAKATVLEAEKDEEIIRLKGRLAEASPLVAQTNYAFLNKISKHAVEPLSIILQLKPNKLARPANVPALKDACFSHSFAKESTVTPASESLEFPTSVVPTSSVVALEQNKEWVIAIVDGSNPEITDDAANVMSRSVFMQGTSCALDDTVGVTAIGSECTSSEPAVMWWWPYPRVLRINRGSEGRAVLRLADEEAASRVTRDGGMIGGWAGGGRRGGGVGHWGRGWEGRVFVCGIAAGEHSCCSELGAYQADPELMPQKRSVGDEVARHVLGVAFGVVLLRMEGRLWYIILFLDMGKVACSDPRLNGTGVRLLQSIAACLLPFWFSCLAFGFLLSEQPMFRESMMSFKSFKNLCYQRRTCCVIMPHNTIAHGWMPVVASGWHRSAFFSSWDLTWMDLVVVNLCYSPFILRGCTLNHTIDTPAYPLVLIVVALTLEKGITVAPLLPFGIAQCLQFVAISFLSFGGHRFRWPQSLARGPIAASILMQSVKGRIGGPLPFGAPSRPQGNGRPLSGMWTCSDHCGEGRLGQALRKVDRGSGKSVVITVLQSGFHAGPGPPLLSCWFGPKSWSEACGVASGVTGALSLCGEPGPSDLGCGIRGSGWMGTYPALGLSSLAWRKHPHYDGGMANDHVYDRQT
ncbi:dual specificity protein phosphatase 1-like protein, partial [Tanacetum coccineum]